MMVSTKSCEESDKPAVKCKTCGKPLFSPEDASLFKQRRQINGAMMEIHYYLCKDCAKEAMAPFCENEESFPIECPINKKGDPDSRISYLKFDSFHGETYCRKCGLVQENLKLYGQGTIDNVRYPKPRKPKDYNPVVQELADDGLVDWFNYTENSLVIVCNENHYNPLREKYPEANLIPI